MQLYMFGCELLLQNCTQAFVKPQIQLPARPLRACERAATTCVLPTAVRNTMMRNNCVCDVAGGALEAVQQRGAGMAGAGATTTAAAAERRGEAAVGAAPACHTGQPLELQPHLDVAK